MSRLLRATGLFGLVLLGCCHCANAVDRPNILWLIVEDMSPHFSCYGETTIKTPYVDQLAQEGTKFNRAFVTAPVCSTARSSLITGMYQTTIGAHHHRSGRGTEKIQLPEGIPLIPQLFQQAGYYTCNGSISNRNGRLGKTDYNFAWDESIYDGNDWQGRKKNQPFFAQIQLHGGKYRDTPNWRERAVRELGGAVDPRDVHLPPYYPEDPVILEDWADYLLSVRYTDLEVGQIVQRLKDEGIYDQTVIFFMTDHGISHVRGKQFLYDEGTRIPMVVRGPGIKEGCVRDDLVVHIDMAATSLALAGIRIPAVLESRDWFAENYSPRPWIISARDRCDETVEHLRSVRTDRYKYIRNFLPDRPYLQPNAYKDNKPILQTMRRLYKEGKLDRNQSLIMATSRPAEELYDVKNDPYELHNLAGDSSFQQTLLELRETLKTWVDQTDDRGREPEPESMYDSDMKAYLTAIVKRHPERAAEIQRNIDQMKQWAREGR